jgi:hypothetical protein
MITLSNLLSKTEARKENKSSTRGIIASNSDYQTIFMEQYKPV